MSKKQRRLKSLLKQLEVTAIKYAENVSFKQAKPSLPVVSYNTYGNARYTSYQQYAPRKRNRVTESSDAIRDRIIAYSEETKEIHA